MLDMLRMQILPAVAAVCLSCQSLIAADTSLPEFIAGTWVLQQAASPGELQRELRGSLAKALETPKIRGFCLRFPWKAADEDFSLIEAGLKIARDHGVAYSIRFMAGRHTPDRVAWPELFRKLYDNRATYCEIYATSFMWKRGSELAAEIRKFDDPIRTGGPLLPKGPH